MDDIDFSSLASQDADFAKVLKSNGQLDFSNPEAVLQLTKSLLKKHFTLKIELPPDRLCPPIPNRFNYIRWIQELIDTTSSSYSDVYEPSREVTGLDIGTGASCIYPLLGCASRPAWKFLGTDIDDKSFEYARRNVEINNLSSRIRLLKTTSDGPLIPLDILGIETIDFTICNPPFYTSTESLLLSCSQKSRPPFTACTGSSTEMIYPGGEVAFLTRLIDESLQLKQRVQWYTSMLGKLESLKEILLILKEKRISNFAVKELIQGTRTRRWAIAWSLTPRLPSLSASRGIKITSSNSGLSKQSLPFPTEFSFFVERSKEEVEQKLNIILISLDLTWTYHPSSTSSTILGFAPSNVWSRASRRQSRRQKPAIPQLSTSLPQPLASMSISTSKDPEMSKDEYDEKEMAFGFKISVRDVSSEREGEDERDGKEAVEVLVRWMKGTDSVLFESFCGMVRRRVEEV